MSINAARSEQPPVEDNQDSLDTLMRAAVREGNDKSYAAALDQMARLARTIVSQKIQNADTAEDIVQDILLSVHQARHTWDGERPFKPWFYAIARYRLLDALRAHYRNKEDTLDDPTHMDMFAAPVTETNELSEQLAMALKSLPAKQRLVVEMMKVQDLSAQDVALKLNMTVSAVKVTAHRAYKSMRSVLESEK